MDTNYYEILGLSRTELERKSEAEIKSLVKKAFYPIAKELHPDKNDGHADAALHLRLTVLTDAYKTLSDPALRATYNYQLDHFIPEADTVSSSSNGRTSNARPEDDLWGDASQSNPFSRDETIDEIRRNAARRHAAYEALRNTFEKQMQEAQDEYFREMAEIERARAALAEARMANMPLAIRLLDKWDKRRSAREELRRKAAWEEANKPPPRNTFGIEDKAINKVLDEIEAGDKSKIPELIASTDFNTELGSKVLSSLIDIKALAGDKDKTAFKIAKKIDLKKHHGVMSMLQIIKDGHAVTRDREYEVDPSKPCYANGIFAKTLNGLSYRTKGGVWLMRALAESGAFNSNFATRFIEDTIEQLGINANGIIEPPNLPAAIKVLQEEGVLNSRCQTGNGFHFMHF